MLADSKRSFFWRSVLVALVYGLLYAGIREVQVFGIYNNNWIPMAALRFTCLLFIPMRYWPALILGEGIAIGCEKLKWAKRSFRLRNRRHHGRSANHKAVLIGRKGSHRIGINHLVLIH